MILISLQTLFLAFAILLTVIKARRIDLAASAYILLWVIGTILIYHRYGVASDLFYSNDQRLMTSMIESINKNGLELSIDSAIALRYVVTIPALVLTKFGIDSLLALKFIQMVCVIFSYKLARQHFESQKLEFKWQYSLFVFGPSLVFNSLLGLRDAVLSFLVLNFVFTNDRKRRFLSICAVYLLRPHLAAALIFGLVVSAAFNKFWLKPSLVSRVALVIGSYATGICTYALVSLYQHGIATDNFRISRLFNQDSFLDLASNFVSLQFLRLGDTVVASSNTSLLLLRLIFFDIFATPIIFTLLIICYKLRSQRNLGIFISFIFFVGVVSNTNWNSSRQNIPFIALMGVAIAEYLAQRRKHSAIEKPGLSPPLHTGLNRS